MHNIVKITTLPNFLDLVAPHYCRGCGRLGQPLCECCKIYIVKNKQSFCPLCKCPKTTGKCPKCKNLPPTYFVNERSALLDKLIHDYKYHSIRALAKPLAKLLDSTLPKNLPKNSIIIPLPTATNHIRNRGFDHTKQIAKQLSKLKHFQLQSAFIRNKNTVQVGSDRKTRLTQVEHAFTINPKFKLDQTATYILFDDVWTTGASMMAATKKLQQARARKIIILILAVSRRD